MLKKALRGFVIPAFMGVSLDLQSSESARSESPIKINSWLSSFRRQPAMIKADLSAVAHHHSAVSQQGFLKRRLTLAQ